MAKALATDADHAQWDSSQRDKLHVAIGGYCVAVLNKLGHPNAEAQLRTEMGKWVQRSGPLSVPPNPQPSPTRYWQSIALVVPMLAKVALAVFSITPSEAAVERSFSHQSLVHSDLRTRLDDSTIEAVMMVRMNVIHFLGIQTLPKPKRLKLTMSE